MDRLNTLVRRVPTWVVYLGGAVPLALLVWRAVTDDLGADPVRALERQLGLLGLQFLLASLAITPLRRIGLNLIRFRRALGLLAFGYLAVHLTVWVVLDLGFRWSELAADLVKRPYIIAGMAGFALLVPLAATSTNAAIRRMGPVAWGRLHRLVYLAVLAGVLHYILLSKVWTGNLLVYAGLALGLLALRLLPKARRRSPAAA